MADPTRNQDDTDRKGGPYEESGQRCRTTGGPSFLGGTYFFTVVTERRAAILCGEQARLLLRQALNDCRDRWPFRIEAVVLLPDHLHTIWSLPPGDTNFSRRWSWIKHRFVRAWTDNGGLEQVVSESRSRNRRRGVWQRRFWEHSIRDEEDFERHVDYIHYNPVKHELARSPRDWPHSSFHRFVRQGIYPPDWGRSEQARLSMLTLKDTIME
jgi:putative transposase